MEVLITAEHYSNEDADPWYYKGHIHKNIVGSIFAGVRGEKYIGIGPMIGLAISEKAEVWIAVPVAYQPDEGRTSMTLGLSVEF